MIPGQTYSFTFNYVSHGVGSDGAFGPAIYTGPSPVLDFHAGALPAAGNSWSTNTFSFTASPWQAGHTWLMVTTAPYGSSGLVNSFCPDCSDTTLINCDVDLGGDRTLCEGSTFLLNATTPNATYLWQDNSTDALFTVSGPGMYWVTVTRSNCSATDSVHVAIKDCATPLEMPNIFTPNRDGQNDLLIPLSFRGIASMHTTIRNRWGQVIYETDLPSIRWDGHGAPEGIYFWVVSYVDVEGEQKSAEGYVTLLR